MKAVCFTVTFLIQAFVIYSISGDRLFSIFFFLIFLCGLFMKIYAKGLADFAKAGWGMFYGSIAAVAFMLALYVFVVTLKIQC